MNHECLLKNFPCFLACSDFLSMMAIINMNFQEHFSIFFSLILSSKQKCMLNCLANWKSRTPFEILPRIPCLLKKLKFVPSPGELFAVFLYPLLPSSLIVKHTKLNKKWNCTKNKVNFSYYVTIFKQITGVS